MTEQFVRDRRRGKVAQEMVKTKLEAQGWDVRMVADGYHPAYDFLAMKNGMQWYGEIKYDSRAKETGNVCLEIPALEHSKASMLLFCTDAPDLRLQVYALPLQDALSFAKSWPIKRVVGENREMAALVPKETFLDRLKPKLI